MINIAQWESKFREKLIQVQTESDPAHDLSHFQRVVNTARAFAIQENAQLEIVIPAAWLHDLVNLPKNDPHRKLASQKAAEAAVQYLKEVQYPESYFDGIYHAIHAHSFSAQIEPKTLEAQVVQDADRLDALGSIGIARCYTVGGILHRSLYHTLDPFADQRELNDSQYTLDHFYTKLLKLGESLQTSAGRKEGEKRIQAMLFYLNELKREIGQ